MQATDDSALLRQYVENHSDEAFALLVAQHINLVYSVALRQVGNPHQAEEITQAVFIILAKKAAELRHNKALSSWLFQAAHLTANNFVRSEIRRHCREQEAFMQSGLNESGTGIWASIAPSLDTAVAGLNEKDRRAIVLRFYEGKNLREVGVALGASEEAAKKRVTRALEKLQRFFLKRGVTSTTEILAGAISANSVQAAPAMLAKTVSAVAMTKGVAASGSTLTLIKGALKIMAWTKAKTAIVAGSVVVLTTAVVTPAYIHFHRHSDLTSNSTIASSADYPKTADQAAKAMVETLFVKGDINEFADKFVDPNPILRKLFIDNFIRGSGGRLHPMPGAQVVAGKPEKIPDSNIWLVPCKLRLKGGAVRECQIHSSGTPKATVGFSSL